MAYTKKQQDKADKADKASPFKKFYDRMFTNNKEISQTRAVKDRRKNLSKQFKATGNDYILYKNKLGKPEKNTKSVYQRLKNKSKHQ